MWNALLVRVAWPDIEVTYSTMRVADSAGGGYMMLTWGLWNQGNSPFTLYAFAYDQDEKTPNYWFDKANAEQLVNPIIAKDPAVAKNAKLDNTSSEI